MDEILLAVDGQTGVTISTSGVSPDGDTTLALRQEDGTLVEFDDDDGALLYSNISRPCATNAQLPAGNYRIEVRGYRDNVTGPYSLQLACSVCAALAMPPAPCVGECWTRRGLEDSSVGVLQRDPVKTDLYAALSSIYGQKRWILRSTDKGSTWAPLDNGPPPGSLTSQVNELAVQATSPRLVAVASDPVQAVVADPLTPSRVLFGGPLGVTGSVIWDVESVDALVFAPGRATVYGYGADGFFRSPDAGLTWMTMSAMPTGSVHRLAVDPVDPQFVYAGSGSRIDLAGGLSISTDGGQTWRQITAGLPVGFEVSSIVIDPMATNRVYISTYRQGVFRSTDRGSTWQAINKQLPSLVVNDLTILSDPTARTLFAALDQGLYALDQTSSACAGDCNGDGVVEPSEITEIAERVRSCGADPVQILCSRDGVATCAAADADGDGVIGPADLGGAVAASMNGCQ